MADTSSNFAHGDGWGNERYEIGLSTVTEFVRGANVVRQLNAREILTVLSRTLHPADALGVVAPERNGSAILCPQRRQRRPPASSTDDDDLFHFRSKRGSRP